MCIRFKSIAFLSVLSLLVCALCVSSVFAAENTKPGDVIVVFRKASATRSLDDKIELQMQEERVSSLVKNMGAGVEKFYPALSKAGNKIFTLVHSDTKTEDELLKELRSNPEVLAVSPNYEIHALGSPNDTYYSKLWGMPKIAADQLWDAGVTGSSDIYVAVIDTGIDYTHEDLSDNFETSNYSRNFSYESSYKDGHSHGTHVAGTIGAVGNNGKGVAGVNWKVKLIALKVLNNSGSGYMSWTIDALEYLTELLQANPGLNLASLNLSLGGYSYTEPTVTTGNPDWVAYKAFSDLNRAVICVAAGNESIAVGEPAPYTDPDGRFYQGQYCYPASLRGIDNLIVVGASASNSTSRASFSNYSTTYVDVAAPGSSIYSTVLNGSYASYNGTSMATPHVAGIAALLKSAFPGATASEIKNAIVSGTDSTAARDYTHYGFVNVKTAYDILSGNPPEPPAPPEPGTGVEINAENFPDSIFRSYISTNFDTDKNGYLSDSEIANTKTINVKSKGINTMKGVEFFTELTSLTIWYNNVETIDLSMNTKLTYLDCDSNKLTALDVSRNTALKTIYASYNQLTELDLSNNTALSSAYFYSQSKPALIITKQSEGKYAVDLNRYVSDISRISSVSGTYDSATGITVFSYEPSSMYYYYDTKSSFSKMSVTLKNPQTPVIITGSLPDATTGTAYSQALEAAGQGSITWSLSEGKLPNGLSLSTEGVISGTPSESGEFAFTVKASNTYGDGTKAFKLVVKAGKPTITTKSLPNATIGKSYSATLEQTGADSVKWTISSGSLPEGLSLNKTTGKITGTAKTEGKVTFKVKATATNKTKATKSLSITVVKAPSISGNLPGGTVKTAYSATLKVTGGTSAYTWSISKGSLPTGLKLDASKGTITGTPTKAGKFSFTVKVTDKNKITATKAYTVIIDPIITGTLSAGTIKGSYTGTLTASTGNSDYTWTVSKGSLPAGLNLTYSGNKATISGTASKAGTFAFTLTVSDKNGATASKIFIITVTKPAIYFTPGNGVLKAAYSDYVFVDGGTASYTWKVSKGSLPDGLKLTYDKASGKATIAGTPTKANTFTFTLKTTDKNKATVSKSFTIKITAPSISGTLSAGTVGTSYSKTLKASGGTAKYTWAKSSGTIPSGLTLNKTSGKLSGTPAKAGKYTFKVKVTDANGATAVKSYTVTINAASTASKAASTEVKVKAANNVLESESILSLNEPGIESIIYAETVSVGAGETETENGSSASVRELHVASEDILSQGTERDDDLVSVKANQPVRFITGEWAEGLSDVKVFVNDEPAEDIMIQEGMFTLPAEMIHDDFKVCVKAKRGDSEIESEELFISAEN